MAEKRERLLLTMVIGQGEIWEWYLVGEMRENIWAYEEPEFMRPIFTLPKYDCWKE